MWAIVTAITILLETTTNYINEGRWGNWQPESYVKGILGETNRTAVSPVSEKYTAYQYFLKTLFLSLDTRVIMWHTS